MDPNDPHTLYASFGANFFFFGSQGAGVYRTTDDGEHWEPVNNGLTNPVILSLVLIPQNANTETLFAGSAGSGIFRATVNGS